MPWSIGINGRPVGDYLKAMVAGVPSIHQKKRGEIPIPLDPDDANLIESYLKERQAMEGGINDGTAKVMAEYLVALARKAGPFRELKKADLLKTLGYFRKHFKITTQARALIVMRGFLQWMVEKGYSQLDPKFLESIKAPSRAQADIQGRKAGDMLTADELKALINGARTARDKAIIALIFESAMRPKEIARLQWGDLVDDKYGYGLSVRGKTNKTRYVRLIWSKPYLLAWKNEYPGEVKHESRVFVGKNKNHKPITQSLIRAVTYDAAKMARLGKKVFPYLLRHSRITGMVADEVPLPVILEQAWGSQDGRMLSTYTHLKNTDIDRIMLARHGIETEKRGVSIKAPQCPQCGAVGSLAARYCEGCGASLTEEVRLGQSSNINKLLDIFAGMSPEEVAEVQRRIRG